MVALVFFVVYIRVVVVLFVVVVVVDNSIAFFTKVSISIRSPSNSFD